VGSKSGPRGLGRRMKKKGPGPRVRNSAVTGGTYQTRGGLEKRFQRAPRPNKAEYSADQIKGEKKGQMGGTGRLGEEVIKRKEMHQNRS